ncbi:hypothetical protein [Pseudoroseicyclus sp. CXY001]|uniref:hypothetical protein n=1 Tax=Pseudoroseicyclus sp. CXY001 TaxID=3242492 RepID=UPI003570C8DD
MPRSALLSATAVASLAALPAFADVTAEDVWHNMTRPTVAMGFDISASPTRSGDTLSVGDVVYSYVLPMDVGSVSLSLTGPEITETGDGTAQILWPEDTEMAFDAEINADGDRMTVHLLFGMSVRQETLASGTPSEVTYETTGSGVEMHLLAFHAEDQYGPTVPELDGEPGFDFFIDYDEMTSLSTISSEGGAVDATAQSRMAGVVQDMTLTLPGVTTIHTVGVMESVVSDVTLALPGGTIDLLNLSDALRRGLALSAETTTTNTQSQTVTEDAYTGMSVSQAQSVASQEATLRFDDDGLVLDATFGGFDFSMPPSPDIPFPLGVSVATGTFGMTLPVNAREETQASRYAFRAEDLAVSDELWNMIDPGGNLPRDPMTLGMELNADLVISQDLLDIMPLIETIEAGESPVDVTNVGFRGLDVRALGAQLTGMGSFAVDLSKTFATGAEPSLDGTADFDLTGLNQALSTLSASGMVPAESIMGVRMGIGMFAEAAGEDALTSHIEINPDGTIFANGQQIK